MFPRKIKWFPLETAAIYLKDKIPLLLYTWNKL